MAVQKTHSMKELFLFFQKLLCSAQWAWYSGTRLSSEHSGMEVGTIRNSRSAWATQEIFVSKQNKTKMQVSELGVVIHTCNFSIQDTGRRTALSLRPSWFTQQILGLLILRRKTLLQNRIK